MKRLICTLLLVALMAAPALCQELSRKYVDSRITVEEESIAIPDLCRLMSEASGATIVPDEDWRVKERRMMVFCHNAALPHVMYSIADVTRLMWTVKDENTYVLCYRPDTDKLISETLRMGADAKVDRGAALVDGMMSRQGENLSDLKKTDPARYLMKSTGAGDVIGRALKSSPNLMKSMASGEKRTFTADEVSDGTLQAVQELNSLILQLANEVCQSRNTPVPRELTRTLSRPIANGNVEIEVNGDIPLGRNRITADQLGAVCSGYAVVRTDGRITGLLPIINTDSAITNTLAQAAVDLLENPGMSFDAVFAGLDMGGLVRAAGKDIMTANDVYKKEIPYDPAMAAMIDLGEPKNLPEALKLFEKATGAPVFCDSFADTGLASSDVLRMLGVDLQWQGTIYQVLTGICDAFDLNVELANGQFDFSDVKWFDKIKAQVSSDTVKKWKNELGATGFLSLETLLEMGRFTPGQLSFAFNSDPDLKPLAGDFVNNANVLEMLSLCDGAALNAMMTEGGVKSGYLNKRAFNAYRSLYQTAGFSGRTPCRIRLESSVTGEALVYTVEFIPDDGSGSKKVEFRIPSAKKQ
ncbi:MAG: hypothetical protein IK083_08650 [Abditibacteriota bacterium]|nr:hypothetical protein [Abditibacteriota bacterium]